MAHRDPRSSHAARSELFSIRAPWVILSLFGLMIFVVGYVVEIYASSYFPAFVLFSMATAVVTSWLLARQYKHTQR